MVLAFLNLPPYPLPLLDDTKLTDSNRKMQKRKISRRVASSAKSTVSTVIIFGSKIQTSCDFADTTRLTK